MLSRCRLLRALASALPATGIGISQNAPEISNDQLRLGATIGHFGPSVDLTSHAQTLPHRRQRPSARGFLLPRFPNTGRNGPNVACLVEEKIGRTPTYLTCR